MGNGLPRRFATHPVTDSVQCSTLSHTTPERTDSCRQKCCANVLSSRNAHAYGTFHHMRLAGWGRRTHAPCEVHLRLRDKNAHGLTRTWTWRTRCVRVREVISNALPETPEVSRWTRHGSAHMFRACTGQTYSSGERANIFNRHRGHGVSLPDWWRGATEGVIIRRYS